MKRLLSVNLAKGFKIMIWGVVLFLLLHCREEVNKTNIPIINLEKGLQKGGVIKLSDLCSSIEYIPLCTDDNSIIGSRPLLNILDGSFYITDNKSDNCKIFDSTGCFLNTIGQKGNSKGEYISIRGFDIEEDRSNVAIRDFNKIVTYNKNGLFVKEVLFDKIKERGYNIGNFVYLGNGRYCTIQHKYEDDTEALSIIDDSGEILLWYDAEVRPTITEKIILDGSMHIGKGSIPPYMYKFYNSIRYISSNNDTIFSFSGKLEKNPVYIINLGNYKQKEYDPGKDKSVTLMLSSLREARDLIFFRFIAPLNMFSYMNPGERFGYALYDKKECTVTALSYDSIYQTTGLKNDIDNGMPFWPDIIIDNKMYQIVDAITFIDMSLLSGSAKMKEIALNLTENSNPVIVAVRFK